MSENTKLLLSEKDALARKDHYAEGGALERLTKGRDKKNAILIADLVGVATTAIGFYLASGFEDKKLQWAVVLATALGNTFTNSEWKKHIERYNPEKNSQSFQR